MVTPKFSVYSATKFALRGYANGLRLEAKKYGVHVMTVNPGPIDTAFFDIADKKGDYKQSVSSMLLAVQDVAKAIHQGIKKKKKRNKHANVDGNCFSIDSTFSNACRICHC